MAIRGTRAVLGRYSGGTRAALGRHSGGTRAVLGRHSGGTRAAFNGTHQRDVDASELVQAEGRGRLWAGSRFRIGRRAFESAVASRVAVAVAVVVVVGRLRLLGRRPRTDLGERPLPLQSVRLARDRARSERGRRRGGEPLLPPAVLCRRLGAAALTAAFAAALALAALVLSAGEERARRDAV